MYCSHQDLSIDLKKNDQTCDAVQFLKSKFKNRKIFLYPCYILHTLGIKNKCEEYMC